MMTTEQRQALVTGATRFICIVGDPVSQVRSPELYNPSLVKAGANVVLIPLHLPSAAFETAMPALCRIANLAGRVFTVPFKERAVRFADEILPTGL
jgi:shikimate 5-dehydrogenase